MNKQKSKHRYSTYTLLVMIILAAAAGVVALNSAEVDLLCADNDSLLKRINGTWQCYNLTGNITGDFVVGGNVTLNGTNGQLVMDNINLQIAFTGWENFPNTVEKSSVGIGAAVIANNTGSVAIGSGARAYGQSSLGLVGQAWGFSSIAIGSTATTFSQNSIGIAGKTGHQNTVGGVDSIAIGTQSRAFSNQSLALGNDVYAGSLPSRSAHWQSDSMNNEYVAAIGLGGYANMQNFSIGFGIGSEELLLLIDGKGAAFGPNDNTGLQNGDINATDIYYDTLNAKSPTFLCESGTTWCYVVSPQYQTSLYLQYDPTNYSIIEVFVDDLTYNEESFISEYCTNNSKATKVCEAILKKLQKLNGNE